MDSDFYPRSPRGERQSQYQSQIDQLIFLSTLPARGATGGIVNIAARDSFLSTLPARGATHAAQDAEILPGISIHAPREGSDLDFNPDTAEVNDISIHAPREGSDGSPGSFPRS